MFTTLIVQPIFNLLVAIYALIPGHNFGLAIILFTIAIRMLMWPLVRKQLHQVKLTRRIQPELKRIKKAANGDRQKESMMMLELYKEQGIKPLRQIGVVLVQGVILFGLYIGLQKVIHDPHNLVSFAYPFLQHLSWLKELGSNIHLFDNTLFGFIDLKRPALDNGGLYFPALILVLGSAVAQFFQSKQLTPTDKDARGLRTILKDAKTGKQADQSEINAVMSRNMLYLFPALILLITIHLPSALSLYWLVGGLVAYLQQTIILREDTDALEAAADKPSAADRANKAVEAEIIEKPDKPTPKKSASKKSSRKKRRK
jgi:YidC/Oxa1 family membrane protein insertase